MREIKEGPDFRQCVERLGGYRAIDRAMETIIEGLMRRSEGFPSHQSALCKVRYAKTKPMAMKSRHSSSFSKLTKMTT